MRDWGTWVVRYVGRAYLGVGHEDYTAVSPCSADVREPNTRVSCRTLDDRAARLQTVLLGHHRTSLRHDRRIGTHRPRCSASRTTPRAARSFTLPPGFCNSLLATMSQPVSRESFSSRICVGLLAADHTNEQGCRETYQRCVPDATDEPVDGARGECASKRLGACPERSRDRHGSGREEGLADTARTDGFIAAVRQKRPPFQWPRTSLQTKASS